MKRRGRHSNTISLFAFQDVMASVIGILFFVVLLMALDIVNRGVSAAEAMEVRPSDLEALRAEADRLQSEIERTRKNLSRAAQRVTLVSLGDRGILREVHESKQKLNAQHEAILERRKANARLSARIESKGKEVTDKRKRLDDVKSDLERLREELKSAKSVPNIAFIIDDWRDNLEPWLVEVSGDDLRVAAKDGSSAVFRFRGKSQAARRQQFLAWAKSQDSRSHYMVLLIKPPGMSDAHELHRALRRMGFQIGTDLLPEKWQAFE